MVTRNEDNRIDQENIEGRDKECRSEVIMNIWEGDTTMLFAIGLGDGNDGHDKKIHRASKSRTMRYQKNDKENK